MVSIEISDAQAEALGALRESLAEDHVGEYGYVRDRDVVQYLLDRYGADEVEVVTGFIEERLREKSYQELQQLAGSTAGVEATGKEADLQQRVAAARAAQVLEPGAWGETDGNPVETGGDTADSGAVPRDERESESGGGGSRLERMMGLLDEYGDVWEETDSEEGNYVVTLPDGSTETVRTKEDVRAVLFKQYE